MNYDKLLKSVKKHEGIRDLLYLDSLSKRTVGYGHLCVEDHWEDGKKYDQEYLEDILEKDLQGAIDQAHDMCQELKISDDAKTIICEMIFQLGGRGVSKFRKCGQRFVRIHQIITRRPSKCSTHVGPNRRLRARQRCQNKCRTVASHDWRRGFKTFSL